jgi:hypothetical protein
MKSIVSWKVKVFGALLFATLMTGCYGGGGWGRGDPGYYGNSGYYSGLGYYGGNGYDRNGNMYYRGWGGDRDHDEGRSISGGEGHRGGEGGGHAGLGSGGHSGGGGFGGGHGGGGGGGHGR